ncbi:lipoprotein [Actinomadura alba]
MAGAAASTALLLSLTGCMGDDGERTNTGGMQLSAAQAVAETSQKTARADSFKADLTVNGGSAQGQTDINLTGQFRVRPDLSFTALLNKAVLSGRSVPGVVGSQGVFVDDTLYVRSQRLSQLMGGKPWLKIDVATAGRLTGTDVNGLLDEVRKVDPAAQAKMLTASKDVRTVGDETVDGVKTTHYAGTVTVGEALKQLDSEARARLQRVYPQNADEKVAFDLWTDGDRLPRKLVTKWTGSTGGENGTLTILYRDYGKAAKPTAPPAGDVQEFDLGRLLGGQPN